MENFFEGMSHWPKPDGALHLYVLPSDEMREKVRELQDQFSGITGLPAMPGAYLHLTLQRLGKYDDELSQPELSNLGAALTEALGGVTAFDLELPSPTVGETAITTEARQSDAWDQLVAAVRKGLAKALGDDHELPTPPHGPHLTLAYANASVDGDVARSSLNGVPPLGTLRVDEVHLVSVTMRPELGIFDFTHLAGWDLA